MADRQEIDQSQTRRRRRDGSSSNVQQRLCPHCGRSFKRSEHLERHVRTRPFYPNFLTCLSPAFLSILLHHADTYPIVISPRGSPAFQLILVL